MMRFPMSLRMFGTAGVNAGVTGVIIRRIIILAVVLIVTVIGALSLSGIGAPRVSSLWTIPAIKSTPGGNRQRESERYQATVRTANDQNITRAMTEGASHLPIPESIPEGRVTEQATGTLPWMQVEEGEARWDPDPLVDRTIDALSPDDDPNGDDGGDDGFESVTGADGQPGAVPGDVDVIDSAGVGHDLPVWESGTPPRIEIVPPEREQAPPVHEQERLDAYAESMLAQMSVIAAGMTIGPMGGQILMAGERREATGDQPEASAADPVTISAGEILYGSIVLEADSDHATPVVARIGSGVLAGTRLIGAFATAERQTGLLISFRTLVAPDGHEHAINAVAVDGISGAGPVVSRVDQRIVSRYGPLLASTFLAGMARSAATPRTVVLNGNGGADIAQDEPTMKQSLYAGLAAAASQAQQDLVSTRPRGPRVVVTTGHPVGILFLETIAIARDRDRDTNASGNESR